MSASALAAARLVLEEGFRAFPYKDTVGKLTIGYGCNLDAGWTEKLARVVLAYQLSQVEASLGAYDWYKGLDEVRQSVILDMAFNMGLNGLLHFPKMIAALGRQDWQMASAELLDSDAARQLPGRYENLAKTLLTGASA